MPDEKRVSQTGGGKAETGQGGQAQAGKTASARKRNLLADSLREFEDAHLNYMQDVRDTWNQIQQEFNEALQQQTRKFSESTQNADATTRFQAQREHLEELQKSIDPNDVKKRFEEAYRNHLRALKQAWANLDVDAIELS